MLKKAHGLLAEENRGLGERASLGRQFLEVELDQAREKYSQELAAVRADAETRLAEMQREAQSTARELEVMTAKYEGAKAKVLEERQRFQEERQKLTAQVRPWLSLTPGEAGTSSLQHSLASNPVIPEYLGGRRRGGC